MPKPKWLLTADDDSALTRAAGKTKVTVAVYDKADLDRRLSEARAAGVKVTVEPN